VEVGWYLTILAFVLLALGGVLGLLGVISPLRLTLAALPFDLDPSAYTIQAGELAERAEVVRATGVLRLENPDAALALGLFSFVLIALTVALVVIFQFRKIFSTLAAGEPFVGDNVRRIRIIAGIMIGAEIVRVLALFLVSLFLRSHLVTEGITVRTAMDFRPGVIFAGLAFLVLGEVFRVGAELREEQSLTV
jgi:hypothetical protein